MLRLGRLILQWALLPPININFNFPPRRHPPPRNYDVPPPKAFDPKSRISPLGAKLMKASNALEETEK